MVEKKKDKSLEIPRKRNRDRENTCPGRRPVNDTKENVTSRDSRAIIAKENGGLRVMDLARTDVSKRLAS